MIECLMTWLKRVFGAGDNVAPLLFAFFPFDPDPVHIIHEVSVVLKDRIDIEWSTGMFVPKSVA